MSTQAIAKTTENAPAQAGAVLTLTDEVRQAWTEATGAAATLEQALAATGTAKTALVFTLAAAAVVQSKGAAEPIKVAAIIGALRAEYPATNTIPGLDNVQTAAQRIASGAYALDLGNYTETRAWLIASLPGVTLKGLKSIQGDRVKEIMPLALAPITETDESKRAAIEAEQIRHRAEIAGAVKKANDAQQTKRGAGQTAAEKKEQQTATVPAFSSTSSADRAAEQSARVLVATVGGIGDAMQRLDAKGMTALVDRLADPRHGLSPVGWSTLARAIQAKAQEMAAERTTDAEPVAEPAKYETAAADAVDAARKKAAAQAKRAATIAAKKAAASAEAISA